MVPILPVGSTSAMTFIQLRFLYQSPVFFVLTIDGKTIPCYTMNTGIDTWEYTTIWKLMVVIDTKTVGMTLAGVEFLSLVTFYSIGSECIEWIKESNAMHGPTDWATRQTSLLVQWDRVFW